MDEKLKETRHNTEEAAKYFTNKMAFTLGPAELKELIDNDKIVVIDVREKEDFDEGHIPSAISIPRKELDSRLDELSKENTHVVYCYNTQCHLAACACRLLALNGFTCMELCGGYKSWTEDFRYATIK